MMTALVDLQKRGDIDKSMSYLDGVIIMTSLNKHNFPVQAIKHVFNVGNLSPYEIS